MSKKYKCVIFDLDGTVLDTERMNIVPLQRLIKEELKQDISYDDLLKYRAFSGKKTLELLGFKEVERSYPKWVKYINEFEEGASLYEGWDQVIKELDNKGIVCGIASSKMKAQYEIDFFPTGLQKYMKSVVLAEDTENHKPHPEPLLKAVELLDISPSETIYVGDTVADFKSSKAAGMKFAIALWGAFDLNGIEADFELNHPSDLLKELNIK